MRREAREVENQRKMAALGFVVIEPGTPADFGEMLADGHGMAGKLMAAIGMRPE